MHLRYGLMTAHDNGETRHAQETMKALGITYQHATPQSISDEWWFWNCENIPSVLPPYLTQLKIRPADAIGWGLDEELAEKIENYK